MIILLCLLDILSNGVFPISHLIKSGFDAYLYTLLLYDRDMESEGEGGFLRGSRDGVDACMQQIEKTCYNLKKPLACLRPFWLLSFRPRPRRGAVPMRPPHRGGMEQEIPSLSPV